MFRTTSQKLLRVMPKLHAKINAMGWEDLFKLSAMLQPDENLIPALVKLDRVAKKCRGEVGYRSHHKLIRKFVEERIEGLGEFQ